jgi:histidinol-phosphatase (PHP family)
MIANYHTHTWRCHHADGEEREYVENAIAGGLKLLGFSDHTPYPFPNGYISPDKMLPSQLENYVDTVLRLRDEYRDDIKILLGLEAEYYPELWEDLMRLLEPYPIEYLLLGQHFVRNAYEGDPYNGKPGHGEHDLRLYCRQCMDGLETGKFLYLAHPDLLNYAGDPLVYEDEMTALCRYCKKHSIPLELNLLGIRESRNYPCSRFWSIAAREENTVIYGSDAHHPEHVYSPEALAKADLFLARHGIPRDRLLDILPGSLTV